jgi:uncharacterized protein (TIGR02246 family)
MKVASILLVMLVAFTLGAKGETEEAAVRKVIQDQVTAWNRGDADAYSKNFAADGTFTNLSEIFFTGREAFRQRDEQIFKTVYRGTTKHDDIVSIRFVRPDVAIVETLQAVTGFQALLPGTTADAKGRLRTRLLQVLVKDGGDWKIAAYHNVDVKAGVSLPEPQ